MKILKKTAIIFCFLFCIELILGFTGTMVMIGGIAIRHILFILAFLSLYAYFFVYLLVNRIKIFSLSKDSYFGSYTAIDIGAVLFEISMILSMTLIPWLKGTSLQYAHSEAFDSAAVFSLFFPASYLIKRKEFEMTKFLEFLKYVVFALALVHIGMYFAQEANPKFIYEFFEGFSNLVHGHSIAPSITLGHGGYTRIIFTTSIYLIVGIYIFFYNLERNKWYDYIIFAVEILAVITTVTKSIWFGIGIGFCVFFLLAVVTNIKNNKNYLLKLLFSSVLGLLVIVGSNKFIFDQIVSIRMENAFVVDDSGKEKEDKKYKSEKEKYMKELDKSGAAESNQIKLEQMKRLTAKWLQSPILGWGYGSYVEGYLRSEVSPFSYEMQFFALMMKIGIVGMGIWLVLFGAQVILQIRRGIKHKNRISTWAFLTVSMGVCVQTNPLLICFTGMSIIILISLLSVQNVSDGMGEAVSVYE